MAIEEKVVQPESVTPADQPVAETPSQPQAPNLDSVKAEYEAKLAAAQKEAAEAQEKFQGIKGKLDEVYKQKEEKRTKELEDQGQYKTLWEEANKTNQEMQQENSNLKQSLEDMKSSYEVSNTKQKALSEIANQGAKAPDQLLELLKDRIQRNSDGKLVIIDGGVEQDFTSFITSLKSPGSNYDHHFNPSNKSGMGAKPSPVGNVSGGSDNPWKTGNLTQQLIMENENPDLAAVLKREAQKK